jgi:glycosyltransferase involved in cell wall biosynthesis
MNDADISIVIPLYNEEENISRLAERLNKLAVSFSKKIEFVLVDDGSRDATSRLVYQLCLEDDHYQAIFLSRNFGHPIALSAGIANARGKEAVFIIDGDLQDPPELLHEFYAEFKNGYDVVYGIRKNRKESRIKKFCYYSFYRILKFMANISIPLDSGDFSLISRRAVDTLNKMPEESRYIRGMRTWIGYKQKGIEYERKERNSGDSKYSFKMLFSLAFNGIFNFSELPIRFITRLGLLATTIAIIYLGYTLFMKFKYGITPQGFTGLLFTIVLFSGVQLLSLGIIGEYVLRIFFQVKKRPLYIIRDRIVNKEIVNG